MAERADNGKRTRFRGVEIKLFTPNPFTPPPRHDQDFPSTPSPEDEEEGKSQKGSPEARGEIVVSGYGGEAGEGGPIPLRIRASRRSEELSPDSGLSPAAVTFANASQEQRRSTTRATQAEQEDKIAEASIEEERRRDVAKALRKALDVREAQRSGAAAVELMAAVALGRAEGKREAR
jgi:hypothetical protein